MSLVFDVGADLNRTTSVPDDTGYTICGWFKGVGSRSGNWAALFSLRQDSSNHHSIGWGNSGTSNFKAYQETDDADITPSFPTYTDWNYYAITCSGTGATDLKAYVWNSSGTLVGSVSIPGKAMTPSSIVCCEENNWNGNNFAYGKLAYVRAFSVGKSQASIESELFAASPIDTANIIGTQLQDSATPSGWNATGLTLDTGDNPPVGSIVIDASGEYIHRTANLPSPHAVTIVGWVKRDVARSGLYTKAFALSTDVSANNISIGKDDQNNWVLEANGSETNFSALPGVGEWAYCGLTCAGSGASDLKGYVWNANGTLLTSVIRQGPATAFTATRLTYGNAYWGLTTDYLGGKVANGRVWDRVLTQAQLEAEMFSPTVVDTTNFNTGFAASGTDIGPNGRDWTLTSTTTDSDTPPVGPRSLVVDAAGEYIGRAANLPGNLQAFTVAGWVKRTQDESGNYYVIAVEGEEPAPTWGMLRNGDGDFCIRDVAANVLFSANPPSAASDVWIYVAIVGTGSGTAEGYWWNSGGTLGGTASATGAPTLVPISLRLGNEAEAANGQKGKYAYWKVWDRALTQANLEAEMFSPTVVDATNFNTGFAGSAIDIGPNGRNWTLTNITTDSDTPPVDSDTPPVGLTPIAMSRTYP